MLGIVPLGSLEYHGPHAPLGTECIIARAIPDHVSKSLDAILFPFLSYSQRPSETKGYPGTISVTGILWSNI